MPADEHFDDHVGYHGPAVLTVDGRDVAVDALLDAHHEPLDGRLHWFGRIRLTGDEDDLDLKHARELQLRTPEGRAAARVGDRDLWGRYRVTGVGRPPYALPEPGPGD